MYIYIYIYVYIEFWIVDRVYGCVLVCGWCEVINVSTTRTKSNQIQPIPFGVSFLRSQSSIYDLVV